MTKTAQSIAVLAVAAAAGVILVRMATQERTYKDRAGNLYTDHGTAETFDSQDALFR